MGDFVIGLANSNGIHGIFEDSEETGYLYLSDHGGSGIIDHIHIYDYPEKLGVEEKDVEVVWSKDESKCGVKIWGNYYGIFDLTSGNKVGHYIRDRNTPPITDSRMLEGL